MVPPSILPNRAMLCSAGRTVLSRQNSVEPWVWTRIGTIGVLNPCVTTMVSVTYGCLRSASLWCPVSCFDGKTSLTWFRFSVVWAQLTAVPAPVRSCPLSCYLIGVTSLLARGRMWTTLRPVQTNRLLCIVDMMVRSMTLLVTLAGRPVMTSVGLAVGRPLTFLMCRLCMTSVEMWCTTLLAGRLWNLAVSLTEWGQCSSCTTTVPVSARRGPFEQNYGVCLVTSGLSCRRTLAWVGSCFAVVVAVVGPMGGGAATAR